MDIKDLILILALAVVIALVINKVVMGADPISQPKLDCAVLQVQADTCRRLFASSPASSNAAPATSFEQLQQQINSLNSPGARSPGDTMAYLSNLQPLITQFGVLARSAPAPPPSMGPSYKKIPNTTVNGAYDWATTTAYRSYAGVGQVVAGRLDDCYNNCKADPKCKGFVRSRVYGTQTITDTTNGMCYKIADNFNAVTSVDANKDYYTKS